MSDKQEFLALLGRVGEALVKISQGDCRTTEQAKELWRQVVRVALYNLGPRV